MAINPALLICAPVLATYFVDNANAQANAGGVITCYQDNSRTTLKNWYYQTGSPGAYTYLPLDNPLTLSANGTITDPSGNDTLPFFYTYDEQDSSVVQPYYITCVDSNGQQQFTRQNFPFLPGGTSPSTQVANFNQLIVNNVFYHNTGVSNFSMVTNAVVAPSQHDGYLPGTGEIRWQKNNTSATDSVTFTAFGLNNDPFLPEPTPEVYLNATCSGAGSSETFKYIQIPLSLHLKTLENVLATVTIWAQNVGSNANLSLAILQYTGAGAATSPVTTPIITLTLNSAWTKYVIPFTFPSNSNLSIGSGGDDAYYLLVQYPLNATFSINFTKPCVYLGSGIPIPTYEFNTYDQIGTIINMPRTGDMRIAINSYTPLGWILMNDGTIGNATTATGQAQARWNVDTWPLYSLLWTNITSGTNGTNVGGTGYAQMYTLTGAPVSAVGASAIADFNAGRKIQLLHALGRVLSSTGNNPTHVLGEYNTPNGGNLDSIVQSSSQLAAHTHTVTVIQAGNTFTPQSTPGGLTSVAAASPVTTSSSGSSAAMDIRQGTLYVQYFMKL